MNKFICNFVFLFLICSCQSLQKSPQYDAVEVSAVYSLNQKTPEFLLLNCVVHSLISGKKYFVPGRLCAMSPNGETIRFGRGKLYKINQQSEIQWVKEKFDIHNHIVLAKTSDEILTISRTYWKDEKQNCYSSDVLMIFNQLGQVTKSFELKNFAAASIFSEEHPKLSEDKKLSCVENKSMPVTRLAMVNLFRVLYDENGLPQGYYAQDIPSGKILLFNLKLELNKVHSINGIALKAPTQIGKNKFLFLDLREVGEAELPYFAKLTEYDLETKIFKTVFNSTIPIFLKNSCATITVLNPHQVMVGHIECTKEPSSENFHVEFIDFATNQSRLLKEEGKNLSSTVEPFYPAESFWKLPDLLQ